MLLDIRSYVPSDESDVISLWQRCGLVRPWNDPRRDIKRKMEVNPELLLVGLVNEKIVAAGMGGYEGHRGWVNYLAVEPLYQRKGLGKQMMLALEARLLAMGCPKINIQVRRDNLAAAEFYRHLGYKVDEVESMGKRLIYDG